MKYKNKSTRKPRAISQADWDAVDSPALDAATLQRMKPVQQAMPEAFLQALREGRIGRPKAAHPKRAISLRLDEDIFMACHASGRGWQTRINTLLREAMLQGRI